MFKKFTEFKLRYEQAKKQIADCNANISDYVNTWIKLADAICSFAKSLKDLGDKEGIKKENKNTEIKIEELKKKYQLSESDVKKYKEISSDLSMYEVNIKEREKELAQIGSEGEIDQFFSSLNWTFVPNIESLPQKLQDVIKKEMEDVDNGILKKANELVVKYKIKLDKDIDDSEKAIIGIKSVNNILIEKYQKNIELNALIKKIEGLNKNLQTIESLEKEINIKRVLLGECQKNIDIEISKREDQFKQLKEDLEAKDQKGADIEFNIEYGLNPGDVERVAKKINLKERSDFVEKNELKVDDIRKKSNEFLKAIYFGKQKINSGNIKKDVIEDTLTLTENILFAAKMEGDRIGGFLETTMTPGRRALFLLRLILDESDDAWPILIDQPEDNLDSRSIAKEIVPFFKGRKKERQIIMASHNANLAIGADSEQIIVANRHGQDKPNLDGKQFNYLTGGIENTKEKSEKIKDTLGSQGIREHACEILDGGKEAFEYRRNKYNFKKRY